MFQYHKIIGHTFNGKILPFTQEDNEKILTYFKDIYHGDDPKSTFDEAFDYISNIPDVKNKAILWALHTLTKAYHAREDDELEEIIFSELTRHIAIIKSGEADHIKLNSFRMIALMYRELPKDSHYKSAFADLVRLIDTRLAN